MSKPNRYRLTWSLPSPLAVSCYTLGFLNSFVLEAHAKLQRSLKHKAPRTTINM